MTATSDNNSHDGGLMTPSQVAGLFGVNPKTVTRWAQAGKLPCIRTLGGHRRYKTAEIRAFLAAPQPQPPQPPAPGHTAAALTLGDIAREFPGWSCWQGVSGNLYAHQRDSRPPVLVRALTPPGLLWRIRRAGAHSPSAGGCG